jgi:hypothetical protein
VARTKQTAHAATESPKYRSDEPRSTPTQPCVADPSRITRYALEVFDAELLRELLCLWSAVVDPDARHGLDGVASFRAIAERKAAVTKRSLERARFDAALCVPGRPVSHVEHELRFWKGQLTSRRRSTNRSHANGCACSTKRSEPLDGDGRTSRR